MSLAFPLAAPKSLSKWQDSGPAALSGPIRSISEESGARDLPGVGGDFVFPTQEPFLLRCLTQLCSDTSCKHQGAWREPQSSPLTKLSWLAELKALEQPVGITFQVPGFPRGLEERASIVADRTVRWPGVQTRARTPWTSPFTLQPQFPCLHIGITPMSPSLGYSED